MKLSELPRRTPATVDIVHDQQAADSIAQRLRELGFVDGERVEVLASGPFGSEPLLVQIGFTRFALRRAEAARIQVHVGAVASAALADTVDDKAMTTAAAQQSLEVEA